MLALPAHYEAPGRAADYRRRFAKSPARVLSNFLELRMLARALRHAGPAARILDVPCGAGRLCSALSAHARHVACADAAAAMLAQARARVAAARGAARPSFVRASAFSLPFADGSFDVTVCWRLLHHFEDGATRVSLLRELARVSKRAVVLSFSDAGTARARRIARTPRDGGRRVAISRETLASEIRDAGLEPARFLRLAGWFSVVGAAVARVGG